MRVRRGEAPRSRLEALTHSNLRQVFGQGRPRVSAAAGAERGGGPPPFDKLRAS
jgi:hypothetical protein